MADEGAIRASDQDRERIVRVLTEQTSQGRLTLAEFEERSGKAYQARTWADLRTLVADLPVHVTFADAPAAHRPVERPSPPPVRRWADAAWVLPVACCLAVVMVGAAVAFRVPFAVIFPLLIVARLARGGPRSAGRRYRSRGWG